MIAVGCGVLGMRLDDNLGTLAVFSGMAEDIPGRMLVWLASPSPRNVDRGSTRQRHMVVLPAGSVPSTEGIASAGAFEALLQPLA